jgi:hypothetical protein
MKITVYMSYGKNSNSNDGLNASLFILNIILMLSFRRPDKEYGL